MCGAGNIYYLGYLFDVSFMGLQHNTGPNRKTTWNLRYFNAITVVQVLKEMIRQNGYQQSQLISASKRIPKKIWLVVFRWLILHLM